MSLQLNVKLFYGLVLQDHLWQEIAAQQHHDEAVKIGSCSEQQLHWLYIAESYQDATETQCNSFIQTDIQPQWRDQLRHYCESNAIPWTDPAWQLVTCVE